MNIIDYTEITDEKLLKKIVASPDCRDEVKEGDEIYAYWHGDNRWLKFKAAKINYDFGPDEDCLCLGFWTEDTVADIGYAYHVVKLTN